MSDSEQKPVTHPKYMSPAEFRDKGYLQEANRQFFHPLGLALSVDIDANKTGKVTLGGIWDYRDDPEGLLFGDATDVEKARRIEELQLGFAAVRHNRFGFVIQPAGDPPPFLDDEDLEDEDVEEQP